MSVKNPDLLPLFDEVVAMLRPYEKKKLEPKRNEPGYYDLWSFREVVIDGRTRAEVYFAAAIIQKSYVGFYYMPVYTHEEAAAMVGPELMATLKGKSCFHIKELTPTLRRQIKAALKDGYALYKARGWV